MDFLNRAYRLGSCLPFLLLAFIGGLLFFRRALSTHSQRVGWLALLVALGPFCVGLVGTGYGCFVCMLPFLRFGISTMRYRRCFSESV